MSAIHHAISVAIAFVRLIMQDQNNANIGSAANITINRDGTVTETSAINIPSAQDWISPKSATVGDAWECLVHKVSGGTLTGTVDTWLALSSNRTWSGPPGTGTISCTISFGKVGTSTSLYQTTFELNNN